MTTYAEAEAARQRAVEVLRTAGLAEHADRLAAIEGQLTEEGDR